VSRKNFSRSAIAPRRGARTLRRGASALRRGARTRVNATRRICTRPQIIFDSRSQSRLHGIPLDIPSNTIPLLLIPNPMIVGLTLPELLPSAIQQSIRLACSRTLERFQKMGDRYQGFQEHVNVICHDHERSQLVVAEINASKQGVYDNLRDAGLPQILRTRACVIEVAINPSEGFAGRGLGFAGRRLGRRWESAGRETSVQRPSHEQPPAFGIRVGEATPGVHEGLVVHRTRKSRVHMSVDDGPLGRTALSRDKQGRKWKPVADAARRSACVTSV
jgi:hypothetical protein